MTKKELIAALEQFDDELDVGVCTVINEERVPFELRSVDIDEDSMEIVLEAHPLGE